MKRPIIIKGNLAFIKLTKGYVARIDAEDVNKVSGYNWSAAVRDTTVYAFRASTRPDRKGVLLHRAILEVTIGQEVDHIDGDGLNNTKSNLRVSSSVQNKMNTKRPSTNKSGVKGVSWDSEKGKWFCSLRVNGKTKYLGRYKTLEEATVVIRGEREKYHGEFANHG